MKFFVTGGAGFIGSALVRYLILEKNAEVLCYDKLTYAGNINSLQMVSKSPNFNFIKGDICNKENLENAISLFEPDYIVHLAAETHVDRSIDGAGEFINTNIIGTFNLLEAAKLYWYRLENNKKKTFRLLHVSTDEVFGSLGESGKFNEDSRYDPSSPYSASKAASDHLVRAWGRTYGLPVLISNCSNNYGPFQFPEKLIPLTILNALENKPISIYGDGLNVRDWLFVDDHARALYEICVKGKAHETYNIGSNNEKTNLDIVNEICKIMDELIPKNIPYSKLIEFVKDRPGHDARYAIDFTKLSKTIGFASQTNLSEGLKQTIKWYIENPSFWREIRQTIYDGSRLGDYNED